MIYSPSKFPAYSIMFTIVTVLYIWSLELIHPTKLNLYIAWPISPHFPQLLPLPLVTTIPLSASVNYNAVCSFCVWLFSLSIVSSRIAYSHKCQNFLLFFFFESECVCLCASVYMYILYIYIWTCVYMYIYIKWMQYFFTHLLMDTWVVPYLGYCE